MKEKRKLLDCVFAHSTWKDGKLHPVYRKPFDLLVVARNEIETKKAALRKKSDFSEILYPGPDSNRHAPNGAWDFKSQASTNSATRANIYHR
jgi:hypothetical protein